MSGSQYWYLLILALLLGAAFYVPTLRHRLRERAREQEREQARRASTTEAPEVADIERGTTDRDGRTGPAARAGDAGAATPDRRPGAGAGPGPGAGTAATEVAPRREPRR